ncbi:MAG TPA: tyrosine-protein phosphatase [Candidatus Limnocylindrales bacterium]|nr:tyrosine-protein phosphatase [Candidatus Limnocylindrales bacterium]
MPSEALRDAPERHIRLPGTRNLRDVGGYPVAGGRRTRWRTLLRTDRLDRLPATSQRRLTDLPIRQVIDLRWPHELAAHPSVFAMSDRVRYRSIPLLDDNPPETTVADVYRRMVDERGAQIAAIVRALLEPAGLPAVVGCAAGKDRTGVTIAIVLSAVGVPSDVVEADYALSAHCFALPVAGAAPDDPIDGALVVDCDPSWIRDTLDHVGRYGGARAYLRRNGLGDDALDRLVELVTEPV